MEINNNYIYFPPKAVKLYSNNSTTFIAEYEWLHNPISICSLDIHLYLHAKMCNIRYMLAMGNLISFLH